MSKWFIAALLVLQVHFAASFLVPLDANAQRTFGGLLRWAWPWGTGDHGPFGPVTAFPPPVFFLAMATAGAFLLAALAVVGIWVPFGWWRALAIAGAGLSLFLMALFFGPTKLVPMALDLLILWAVLTDQLFAAPR